MRKYNFGRMTPEPLRRKAFLLPALATGTCGNIAASFTAFPLLVPAVVLPSGVLFPNYGGTCTISGRSAALRHLFRQTGKKLIISFLSGLGIA